MFSSLTPRASGTRWVPSLRIGAPRATASPHGKQRRIYDAKGGRRLPGHLVRQEGGPVSRDTEVNEAYRGAGLTYDFFHKIYGRNSLDAKGMRLDGSVHYGKRYDNAFWNGQQMVYGDGDGEFFEHFTKAIDVIGHELTHGVVQFEAGLIYQDEPGALNESFADVFGSLIKQYSRRQKASEADWLIGKGLFTKKVKGQALRSLKSPGTAYDDPILGRDPQPAHMKDFLRTTQDNGGVHINSGIPNKAFYEVAIRLGGLAWEKAGKIWYAALTEKIDPEASFKSAAQATVVAARELFGSASKEEEAVREGWDAVGIKASVSGDKKKKTRPRTRVNLKRTGGLAGIPKTWQLDERTLSPRKIEDFKKLLKGANFFRLPRKIPSPTQARDVFCYELTWEDRQRCHTVCCAESSASSHLQECIAWILEQSRVY